MITEAAELVMTEARRVRHYGGGGGMEVSTLRRYGGPSVWWHIDTMGNGVDGGDGGGVDGGDGGGVDH